ncbi:MAG TPA: SRPBCC domain-containing protein [Thermoanaerobaculia bacterium]|nr:SRPBCC domain-containing protein [Thermoanaerobaculia bacterium]
MNDAAVVVRRTFRASKERLFRAWSDPQELMQWFSPDGFENPSVEAEARPGGRFRIAMRKLPDGNPFYATGEYRVVEPPSRLVFTWTWEDPSENVRDTVVTIDLLDRGEENTEVVLTHELLPVEKREPHTQGWNAILAKLATTIQ